ncbi:unnamed protein product [Nezara viridula]|uniref:Uncharacterized protein n=1 Tax=Nezara viridula TaxID=85310 RepID=A0A9P0E6M3_NEZVI|nr:unnamed protein product [Nezara viridula]
MASSDSKLHEYASRRLASRRRNKKPTDGGRKKEGYCPGQSLAGSGPCHRVLCVPVISSISGAVMDR